MNSATASVFTKTYLANSKPKNLEKQIAFSGSVQKIMDPDGIKVTDPSDPDPKKLASTGYTHSLISDGQRCLGNPSTFRKPRNSR
jgi:hypothetical protein